MSLCTLLLLLFLLVEHNGDTGKTSRYQMDQVMSYVAANPINNASTYFLHTSGCIERFYKTRTTQGNPPRYCRLNSLQGLSDININDIKCTFEVVNVSKSVEGSSLIISFDLYAATQSNGSSFKISYLDSNKVRKFVWCDSRYTKKYYNLQCKISKASFDQDSTSRCITLRVELEYENFEAVHDIEGAQSSPTSCVVSNDDTDRSPLRVCVEEFDSSPDVGAMKRSSLSSEQITSCLSSNATTYLIGSSHMRYTWDAIMSTHLNGVKLLTSLPQHHSDASIASLHYVSNLFVMQLPALLNDMCDSINDKVHAYFATHHSLEHIKQHIEVTNIVVQTFAWDLDYHAVRNVLQYPVSVPVLLETISRLAHSVCGQFMNFVWVTAVPLPECPKDWRLEASRATNKGHKQALMSCTASSRGYRNNYAIAAVNQYMVTQLESIQKPSRLSAFQKLDKRNLPKLMDTINLKHATSLNNVIPFVRVVDAFELIYPTHSSHVCGLHFTCAEHTGRGHDKAVKILNTPGGEAVIEHILEAVCQRN